MRAWHLLPLLVLALVLPSVGAITFDVARQTDTILQTRLGVVIYSQLEVNVGNGTPPAPGGVGTGPLTPDGLVEFWVPSGEDGPLADFIHEGARQRLAQSQFKKLMTSEPGLNIYRLNLTEEEKALQAGDSFTVIFTYGLDTTSVQLRTRYAPRNLLIFATPNGSFEPSSLKLGKLQISSGTQYHAFAPSPGADFTYDVFFRPVAPPAAAKALNQYLWGLGGLLVGLGVARFGAKRGWFGAPAAKKFVKGGEGESAPMLEARRRTLMAALRELEQAHDAKEVPDDVHGALKEEYKAQAVRVMRSLEEKRESR